MSASVHVELSLPIATVRLDNPDRHNVLDRQAWRDLADAFHTLSARSDVQCIAVRGTGGRAFSAGSDIAAFASQRTSEEDARSYSEAIVGAMSAVRLCRHPTVAIIEGLCVGGGLEIAACCDLRVCGESSRFGAPINRLGLTMSHAELEPLIQLVGTGPVRELLLTGELIDAERARVVGLVNRVHPDRAVVEQGYGLVARIAAGAPLVNRWHKKFIHRLERGAAVTEEEREEALEAFTTDDYREGQLSFLEKRDPNFRGS